jgi:outer membrane protein TolC
MILIGLGGCALSGTADQEVAAALERYRQASASDGASYTPGREHPATSQPSPVSQPLTTRQAVKSQPVEAGGPLQSLRDYIVLALRENPDIKAAEQAARATAARVAQVTALPDPMLMAKVLPEPVETAGGDNYFILGVQQSFPIPQKLDRAGRIALQEARMALAELQQTRLAVIAEVKRTYFRLYMIDMTIEIDLANQELLRELIDVVQSQVAAGRGTQGDALRAQVELSTLESQLIELRQQGQSAAALLNRVLSRPPGTVVPQPSPFDLRGVDLTLERLLELAVETNPDLQRLQQQIGRDREAVRLARLAWWPDFTVGLEWMPMEPRPAFVPPPDPQTGMVPMVDRMSESGRDNWAITFGMSIPLWLEKIAGGVREARSRLLGSQHQLVSARNRVCSEVEDAYARVRAQQELAELFRSTIIPQAQQAYEVSRAAYASGTADFLFVIDNWQEWLTFTVQYHRALGELERSVADLEQALGLSLSQVGGGS